MTLGVALQHQIRCFRCCAIQARAVRIERVVSRYASWMMKNPARSAKPKMPITRNAEMSNAKRFPLGR